MPNRNKRTHTIGSGPIEAEYAEMMTGIARIIDEGFNGNARPKRVGFILMVFPFEGARDGRCNYMSNASRADVITLLKEQLRYFEGVSDAQPPGHG